MPTGERRRAPARAQSGFGYVWTLIAVAAFGIALAAIGELWSTQGQREREAELLAVGRAYRDAIASYYASSRAGAPAYPARLEELLEDRRGPALRRHLRKLYADPVTGSDDWGLVTTADGRIRGVHSRSAGAPIKTANFAPGEGAFEKAASYADWRFEHVLAGPLAPQKR
ncbi:MAG TPA: type II secretion system protein [Burkholderiales bacterium]